MAAKLTRLRPNHADPLRVTRLSFKAALTFGGRGCPVSLGLALAGLGLLPAAGARSNFGEETENRLMPGAGEMIRLPTLVFFIVGGSVQSPRRVCNVT